MPSFAPIRLIALLLGAGGLLPSAATAQPFVVDDTGLAPEGAVQVESWHHRDASWLVPSAQVTRGLDVVGGIALLHVAPFGAEQMALDLQGKWQVRPPRRSWSAALVAGATAEVPTTDGRAARLAATYAYGATGLSLLGEQLTLYANAGWSRARNGPSLLTGGLRADVRLTDRFIAIGEVFGTGRSAPGAQASLHVRPGPDWLELNATVTRARRAETYQTRLTLGLVAVLDARR